MHFEVFFSLDVNDFSKLYFMYKLREVFTVSTLNITIEALKFMSEDQFDVRRGPNLKLQFLCTF